MELPSRGVTRCSAACLFDVNLNWSEALYILMLDEVSFWSLIGQEDVKMNKLIVILLAGIFSVVSFSALADHTPEHTQAAATSKPAKTEI